jgi:hypothetical protein
VYAGEAMLLEFIRQAPKLDTREKLKAGYRELKEKLLALRNKPFENNLFLYFDFISWLEGKIEGKPFGEVVRGRG